MPYIDVYLALERAVVAATALGDVELVAAVSEMVDDVYFHRLSDDARMVVDGRKVIRATVAVEDDDNIELGGEHD